jgi:putative ABC transport system permease protein
LKAWINIREALRAIGAHKLRSILTMLGVVIGVAAVITTVAVGEGAQQKVEQQLRTLGANLLLVTPGVRKKEGVVLQAGSRRSITVEDARAIASGSATVLAVGAYIAGNARLVAGNRNWTTRIAGVTSDYLQAREWKVGLGQPLLPHHEANAAKVVLLGETVAKALFGPGERIGRVIRIKNTPFTVLGVLQQKGQSASGRDQDNIVFMPISTARVRVLGREQIKPSSVHGIVVRVVANEQLRRAAHQIRAILRLRHRLWPDERDDFRIRDLTQIAKTREQAIRQFTLLVGIIASVSLIVGGIGIMNTVLISVTERLREIGIRLAVGAEPGDIRGQFLVESLTLSALGGVLGVAFGLGASFAVTGFLGWPTRVSPEAIGLAIVLSAAVGVVFGLYPAFKAARTEPAVSLRVE